MLKRSATEEAPGASPPKKIHSRNEEYPYPDEVDDDMSTAQTPSTTADAESHTTTVTTPRPKFPSDLKTLACTWPGCPKTFNRPARLRDHLNSHTNSRPFACPYDGCDKDYIEDKHLKQHIKAVHTNERKHVCQREGCGKSFVTGTRLKRHQAVHEGEDRFRCQECGQSFRKRETLTKHVRRDHLGQPEHLCPEPGCGNAFASKGALNRHREKEHGEIKFWCDECGAATTMGEDGTTTQQRVGFTTEILLREHMKRDHQNCMFCDFRAATQYDMEQHIEMRHSGKSVDDRKTILCPHDGCAKRFTKRSNLNVHYRTAHEGVRFVCGQVDLPSLLPEGWSNDQGCGDKFSSKAKLDEHVRYIHLGLERPKSSRPEPNFVDKIAGITTETKANIACPDCDAMFSRYADLQSHTTAVHGASHDSQNTATRIPPPPLFNDDDHLDATSSTWAEDLPADDQIFASGMDFDAQPDDWLEDEANILLLAREAEYHDAIIDPALGL